MKKGERLPVPQTGSEKTEPLELTKSPEGLPAVEITKPSAHQFSIVRRVMTANRLDDPDYQARSKVGAFLQSGDDRDWILIEFWTGTPELHKVFLDHLNSRLSEK